MRVATGNTSVVLALSCEWPFCLLWLDKSIFADIGLMGEACNAKVMRGREWRYQDYG